MVEIIKYLTVLVLFVIAVVGICRLKLFRIWKKYIIGFAVVIVLIGSIIIAWRFISQEHFFVAIRDENIDELSKMLSENIDLLNSKNIYGETALQTAIKQHNSNIVQMLLGFGADVNSKGDIKSTPLYLAVYINDLPMIKTLIENGADVNLKSASGITPLHLAAEKGYVDIVKTLLEKGAEVNVQGYRERATPLHIAVNHRNYQIVEILLRSGADIKAADRSNETPYDWAKRKKDEKIEELLLNYHK